MLQHIFNPPPPLLLTNLYGAAGFSSTEDAGAERTPSLKASRLVGQVSSGGPSMVWCPPLKLYNELIVVHEWSKRELSMHKSSMDLLTRLALTLC